MRDFGVRWIPLLLGAALTVPAVWAQAPSFSQGPNFGTWSIGEIEISLTATGGNGIYSWSVTAEALPPGISLRTDPEVWFPASASAGLIGVATTPGTYSFTLSVTSNGQTSNQLCSIEITALLVKDVYNLPNAFVNSAYSYTLTALNNNPMGTVMWKNPSGLPPGMNLSTAGVLSGTPTTPGIYNVGFQMTDGFDTISRGVQVGVYAINITSPFALSNGALPNATQYSGYNTTVTATGGTGSYTFTNNGLPAGLTLSPSGAISGTVTQGPGRYGFSLTATDTNNVSYTENMSIDVIGVSPQLPEVLPYNYGNSFVDCAIGAQCGQGLFALNGGTAPFLWSASGLPPGMSIRTGNGITSCCYTPGDAEIWGTPTAVGTYSVQVTVTDAMGVTATNTFPLHISALLVDGNDYLPNGTVGVAYSHKMRVLGGSIPAGLASYTATLVGGQLPAGLSFNSSTLVMSGIPIENGGFEAIFEFTDGASNTFQTISYFNIAGAAGTNITINNGNTLGPFTLGTTLNNFQLFACCVASYTWTQTGGTMPPGITLSSSGALNGLFTTAGTYTFTVQAADSTNPANFGVRQYTLVVTPISLITGALPYGNVGSLYGGSVNGVTLTATGGTGALTWTLTPFSGSYLPPGLTLAPNGTLSGTPTSTGLYNFRVTVTDAAMPANVNTFYFSIPVYAPMAKPPLNVQFGPNFGTWSIGEVQYALTATGANGTYSWSVSGSLPPGISLRTDPEVWFPASASAGLIGVATTPGTYNFTLSVTSAGQTINLPCTVKVTALLVKDVYASPDAFTNVPYSRTLTALNNAGPVTWTPTSELPAGITLSPGGVLSGTPTISGFYNINFQVTDGVDTVGRGVQLSVYDIDIYDPDFILPGVGVLPNATQNAAYSTTVKATGGTGSYTFTTNGLPGGLTLSPSGLISGTVTQGPGKFGFSLTATDTNNVSYSKNVSIDVIGVPPQLPEINPYGYFLGDAILGVNFSQGMFVGSGGTAPFSWTATGLPPGMSIRWGGGVTSYYYTPGDAEIWGTPTETGDYSVTVTVTDAMGVTATNTFPLHVSTLVVDGNDYLPSGTYGVPYSHTMRVLGGTIPAGLASYSVQLLAGQLPAGLSFNPTTFVMSGTPMETGGFYAIFKFTDSVGNTFQTTSYFSIAGNGTTITINNGDNLGTYTVGTNLNFQLSACCVPSYLWTFTAGTMPPGFSLSPSGLLSGTLNTAGTYVFTVQAADATNSTHNFGYRQFTLVVTPISITSGALPYGNVGSLYNGSVSGVTLTATGGTGTLTWTLAPFTNSYLPPGLTLASNGTLSGTPTATGFYYFTVKVTDTASNTQTRFFSLDIYAAGATPPLNLPFGPNLGTSLLGTFTYQLSATGGQPPYHYSLTPSANVIPGMRVQDGQPLPTFFAANITGGFLGVMTASGVYTTSIRVTDSTGRTFDQAVTLTVSPLNILSLQSNPKATVNTPYSFTLVPYGGSGNYSWSATSLPPGLTINSSTGQISGTPTAAGTYFPGVTLTDLANSNSVGIGETLVVDPFAITTGGVLTQGTVGTAYSQTLTAPNCGSLCTWTTSFGFPGLSLSAAGVLSGTPLASTNTFFTIQASGSNGTVQKVFSLLIVNNTSILALSINNGSPIGYSPVGTFVAPALTASGGTAPYTWTLQSGALPTGVTLNSPGENFSSSFAPGFTYLSGRAMQTGTFNFTLSVTDAAHNTVAKSFVWYITALTPENTGLPISGNPLVYNSPYTQPLLVIGGTGSYTWTPTTPMPPGLTLNASTGVVSGTPSNTGSFSIPIQVTDGLGNSTLFNEGFNISAPTAATISLNLGTTLGPVAQGGTVTDNLLPSGGTGGPYTFTALTPLPPGFALETGNAVLSNGTPGVSYFLAGTPLSSGSFTFTLQVTDSLGNIGVRTCTLLVAPFTLDTGILNDASLGVAYSQPLPIFDNSGAVTWSVNPSSGMPPGLGVSAAGVITGTPTQTGTFSFTLNATDPSGFVLSFVFSLRVSGISINGPQILQPAIVDTPYSYTFTATGGVSTLTWSATGLPAGLTLSATGTLSGTVSVGGNTFSIVVTATDGVTPVAERFTLFTRSPNPVELTYPPFNAALSDATVGQSYVFNLAPSGGTPPYTWSVALGSSLPPGLNLLAGPALPANFTPDSTVLAGVVSAVGSYSFDLIATDSTKPLGAQVRRTFTLNVSAIGILSGSPRTAIVGTVYTEQFTGVGGTGSYTFSMTPSSPQQDMLPPGLTLSAAGAISGTPASTGNYSFVLKAQDGAGNTFSRSYSLVVTNAAGLFVFGANPPDDSVGVISSTSLVVNGASTYTWTVSAGSLPPGVTLVPGTSTLEGAPTTPGTYVYTMRATDNANPANFADHVFTFRVAPMQVVSPPTVGPAFSNLPSGQVGAPYSFTFKAAGGKPPYTYSESPFSPLPATMTLSSAGVLSGTWGAIGKYVVAPIVTDSAGYILNSPVLAVTVTPLGVPPPLVGSPSVFVLAGVGVGEVLSTFELDQYIQTGTPPYTWSIATGSLPPGLTLLPGSNAVSTYLGGIATTAGTYNFPLTVMDASGQTLTIPFTVLVEPLALTPGSLPSGVVGSPYSVTLTPTGGASPYVIQTFASSGMPPGLALNTIGSTTALSGTPTNAGSFSVQVFLTDNAGNEFGVLYTITIDDAAGEAPALSIAPSSLQVSYVQGSAASSVPVSVNTTSGALPFNLSVSGLPGATLSANSGTSLTLPELPGAKSATLNLNLAALPVGTYFAVLAANASQTANLFVSTPVTVNVVPCSYTVNPTSGTSPVGGSGSSTGTSFTVSAGSGCSWTATASDPSWITITAGSSGIGTKNVTYKIADGTMYAPRNGSITINGVNGQVVYTITQFGPNCSYAINHTSLSVGAAGGTATIGITASSGSGCATWTVSGLSAMPPSGVGSGNTLVTIPPNTTTSTQMLMATIAGQTLTVTQSGINCTVSLGSNSASAPSGGNPSGAVTVTTPAGCPYSTVLGPSWISVTSGLSGVGSGILAYSVDPNSTTVSRTGSLSIGGQPFQITQDPTCSVSLDPSGLGSPYGTAGGTGLIGITTNLSSCSWTASSGAAFATVVPASGTGNGSVAVTVGSNASSVTPQSTTITINGQTVPITQAGTTCTYSLQSSNASVPATGGAGSVGVIAASACSWTSVSNNTDWLTITSSGTGGSANVQFVALANPNSSARVGTLTIAGLTYTVTQAGASCSYSLSSTNTAVASGGLMAGSFTISTTAAGCTPTVLSYTNWITVTSSTFTGTSGTVNYSVAANPAGTTRTGTIQAGDQTFTISQLGAACAYSLESYGAVFSDLGGPGTLLGSPSALGCNPVFGTDQPSFISLGALSGPVLDIFTLPYAVAPFSSLTNAVQIGHITFGGQILTIKQTSW